MYFWSPHVKAGGLTTSATFLAKLHSLVGSTVTQRRIRNETHSQEFEFVQIGTWQYTAFDDRREHRDKNQYIELNNAYFTRLA